MPIDFPPKRRGPSFHDRIFRVGKGVGKAGPSRQTVAIVGGAKGGKGGGRGGSAVGGGSAKVPAPSRRNPTLFPSKERNHFNRVLGRTPGRGVSYFLRIKYSTYRIKARDLGDTCNVNPPCLSCDDGTPSTVSDSDSDAVICPPRWFWEVLLQFAFANVNNPLLPAALRELMNVGPPCLSDISIFDDCDLYDCIAAANLSVALYVQSRWDNYQATGTIFGEDPNDNYSAVLVVKKALLRFCGTLVSTRCVDLPLCNMVCDSDSNPPGG